MAKFVLGILVAIVGGLVVFLLTREGGVFNPQSEDVSISAYTLSTVPGRVLSAKVTVSNVGQAPLESCRLFWNPSARDIDGDVTSLLARSRAGQLSFSSSFALQPGDQEIVYLTSRRIYQGEQAFSTGAIVRCDKAASEASLNFQK
jgi:hypothetical protein